MKRVRGGASSRRVARDGLVAAQTPQAFPADTLRRALAGDATERPTAPSLVERAGGRVRVVDGRSAGC